MRKFMPLVLLVAAMGLVFCIGCSRPSLSFDEVFARIEEMGRSEEKKEFDKAAPYFLDRYAEVVAQLDFNNYLFCMEILVRHGHLYAAVHLDPYLEKVCVYLEKVSGDKQVILAAIVHQFSHGNNWTAWGILDHASRNGGPEVKKLAGEALAGLPPDYQINHELADAFECEVKPGEWVLTPKHERWEIIERCVARGGGRAVSRPDDDSFYLTVAMQLDERSWFRLGRLCVAFSTDRSAVKLSPLIDYVEGDRKILLAAMVALFSHGNSPAAMEVLKSGEEEAKSPEVCQMVVSVKRYLQFMQQKLIEADLNRTDLRKYSKDQWEAMPLPERWKAMGGKDYEVD